MEDRTDVSSKNSTEEPKPVDWLSYYKILIEDIRYAKNQQWRLAYYTLLLLGATAAASRYLKPPLQATIALFLAALALSIFATHYLFKFQRDLWRYRTNVSRIREEKFPDDLRDISKYDPAEKDPYYYSDFLTLLVVVIWVVLFFVAWAIGFWQLLFCDIQLQ